MATPAGNQARRAPAEAGLADTVRPAEMEVRRDDHLVAGKYRLVRKIGAGGMGAVYEAEHVMTGRRLALKTLLAEKAGVGPYVARFLREARAASQVGHPGIVEVIDAGVDGDRPYLVLELLRGRELSSYVDAGTLTLGDVQKIGVEVLDALSAAHAQGIIHRDIKPENIFLHEDEDGTRTKVLDFGIAKQTGGPADTKLTVTGTVMGTPHYMSPEQARGMPVDARADLWAVGAVLFHCLTGRPPFEGDNYNILISRLLTEEPPSLRELRPELPDPILDAVEGALRKDPGLRFDTAAEMRDVLAEDGDITAIRRGDGSSAWGALPCGVLGAGTRADSGMPTADALDDPPSDAAQVVGDTHVDPGAAPAIAVPRASSRPTAELTAAAGLGPSSRRWMIAIVAVIVAGVAAAGWALAPGDEPPAPAAAAPAPIPEPLPEPEPEPEPAAAPPVTTVRELPSGVDTPAPVEAPAAAPSRPRAEARAPASARPRVVEMEAPPPSAMEVAMEAPRPPPTKESPSGMRGRYTFTRDYE